MSCVFLTALLVLPVLGQTDSAAEKPLGLADVIEKVEPGVVRVAAGNGIGSGFVVDPGGLVVTNYHVISGAKEATLIFADGLELKVTGYAAVAAEKDLVVLRASPEKDLASVPLRNELPRKGESVIAFGAPQGLDFTVSEGIVSAIRTGKELKRVTPGSHQVKELDDEMQWIQTTAPISPGNSGGPLVDVQGRVVGVNTITRAGGQNLNFAVASTEVAKLVSGVGNDTFALPIRREHVSPMPTAPAGAFSCYEGFDYAPPGADLLGQNGGEGFDGSSWFPSGFNARGYANYDVAEGSLTFANLATSGNRVVSEPVSAIAGIGRRLAAPITDDQIGTRYISFLLRPEGKIGAGAWTGFFGLYLDGTGHSDLFIGTPGSPATYSLETRGGRSRMFSEVEAVVDETALLVVRAVFAPGPDTFTLYVNPQPGGPEPSSGTVKDDLDVGEVRTLVIYSCGGFSIDELRVGETYSEVVPVAAE